MSNALRFKNFERTPEADVDITVIETPEGLIVKIQGRMDMESPAKLLGDYVQNLHDMILQKGIKTVELDFRDLKYMNSAAISFLTTNWFRKVKQENSYEFLITFPSRYGGLLKLF